MSEIEMSKDPMLPDALKPCFWDCDLSSLDLLLHSRFIVERILVYGNGAAVRWLLNNVHEEEWKDIIAAGKNLDPKTRNYWRLWIEHRAKN